jgi:hypothetical protein
MKGLEQLPPVSETVFRGIPGCHLAMVRSKYLLGGDVHFSAFNSTSTLMLIKPSALRKGRYAKSPRAMTLTITTHEHAAGWRYIQDPNPQRPSRHRVSSLRLPLS